MNKTAKNVMKIAIQVLLSGISFKKIAAVIIPKTTSVWTKSAAVEVSKIFKPENVNPYWSVADTKEI